MFFSGRDLMILDQELEDVRRRANHERLVRAALRARREQEAALGLPPVWQRVPAEAAGRALAAAGRRLLETGEWLHSRYAEPQPQCSETST